MSRKTRGNLSIGNTASNLSEDILVFGGSNFGLVIILVKKIATENKTWDPKM